MQLYFPDEVLDQLNKDVDPYRTHRQMTVTVQRQGDVLVAEATIGIATIGTMGTRTLFR